MTSSPESPDRSGTSEVAQGRGCDLTSHGGTNAGSCGGQFGSPWHGEELFLSTAPLDVSAAAVPLAGLPVQLVTLFLTKHRGRLEKNPFFSPPESTRES